jgi:hypothetical protein
MVIKQSYVEHCSKILRRHGGGKKPNRDVSYHKESNAVVHSQEIAHAVPMKRKTSTMDSIAFHNIRYITSDDSVRTVLVANTRASHPNFRGIATAKGGILGTCLEILGSNP